MDSQWKDETPQVVIVDLGARDFQAKFQTAAQVPKSSGGDVLWVRVALILIFGFVLISISADSTRNQYQVLDTTSRPSACSAIAEMQKDSIGAELRNGRSQSKLPSFSANPGYVVIAAVDTATGKDKPYALLGPDGLWEFCSSAEQFSGIDPSLIPAEERSHDLAQGLSYVYEQDPTTFRYSVVGIRLQNGFVVDQVAP